MRDGKLDFFKGLLIWSVVLGHTLNALTPAENVLHSLLRTFDLPMFMYISGYLLRGSIARYDWRQLILNKFTNIVVPALIWMCISLLFGDKCFYYFLWAVFVSSLIVCICEKISSKHIMSCIFVCLAAIIFHLIPINIINISFLYPFFIFGYYSKNIAQIGWKTGWVSFLIFVSLFVSVWQSDYSIWKSGGYVLHNSEYMLKVVALRLIIGMAGIYTVAFLGGKLYDRYKTLSLINLFVKIGKETLSIYLLQHIIVEILLNRAVNGSTLSMLFADNSLLAGYVLSPMVSLILLFLMYGVILLIQKSKYTKWLFGFRVTLPSNISVR